VKSPDTSSILDGLFVEEVSGEIVPVDTSLTLADEKTKDLQSIEDKLFDRSAEILEGALRFTEVNPTDTEPPAEWINEFGYTKAKRMLQSATTAWMSAKNAPVGIKVAESIARGVMKARSLEKAAPKSLAVAFLNNTVHHHYETKEVDSDD
jgi:hypothetical protein